MERTISASTTFFHKYLLPLLWIGGFGIGTLKLLFDPRNVVFNGVRGAATPADQLILLATWIAGSAFLLWFSVPLKRVRLRANGLRGSNYLREITIPFGAIERITQNLVISGRNVTIYFRYQTSFGRQITFMPAGFGILTFWREDRVVKELRQYVSQAKTIARSEEEV